MSKRLTTAGIHAKVMGQEVEIVVAYPAITVKTIETGEKRTGEILKGKSSLEMTGQRVMILWEGETWSDDDAQLESEVLSVCRDAQLVWAREDR